MKEDRARSKLKGWDILEDLSLLLKEERGLSRLEVWEDWGSLGVFLARRSEGYELVDLRFTELLEIILLGGEIFSVWALI